MDSALKSIVRQSITAAFNECLQKKVIRYVLNLKWMETISFARSRRTIAIERCSAVGHVFAIATIRSRRSLVAVRI